MTDSEIIKALECCANNPNDSVCYESKCPLFGQKCIDVLSKNALDLINRLQAENEELVGNIDRLKAELFDKTEQLKTAKTEAYKEFAGRLTTKIVNTPFGVNCTGETDSYREDCLHGLVAKQNNVIDMIDNLLKEMVGDENERKN